MSEWYHWTKSDHTMKLILLSLFIGVAVAELKAPTNPSDYGKRNEEVYKYRKAVYGNNGYYGAGYGAGYYGPGYGHGYGYAKTYAAPSYKVVKVEAKPAAYGYGHGYYGAGYGHGYGYAKTYAAPSYETVKVEAKPASYGYGHDYNDGYYGNYGLYQKVESHYGNTAFAYNDGASARREHIRADGTVVGSYSLVDANGNKRTVNYKAGPNGFEVDGDTGVDKATADAAAELAAQAPTAAPVEEASLPVAPEVPEVPDVELPVAPTNPPDYGKRNEDVYKYRKAAYGNYGAYGVGGNYGGGYYGAGHYGKGYGYGAGHYGKAYGYNTAVSHGYYGQAKYHY